MKPFPDQVIGTDWLKRSPDAILGDVPGLGKTGQVIRAAIETGSERAIIACPAVARLNWERELQAWGWELPIVRVTSKEHHTLPHPNAPQAVILSYSSLAQSKVLRGHVNAGLWDALILDEAHRLKNPETSQTKAVYGNNVDATKCLAGKALRRWLLSGSIMPNSGLELWTHFHALWPGLISTSYGKPMDYHQFMERYFLVEHGEYGPKVIGYKDVDGLSALLHSVMLRRTYIAGMPELIIHERPYVVEVDDARLKQLEQHEEFEDLITVLDSADARHQNLDAIEDDYFHLGTLRRLTGVLKAGPAAEVIINQTGPEDKVLVFAIHTEVIERIEDQMAIAGMQPAVVHGKIPDGQRNVEIDRFQNDPNCRAFIGQVTACQEAITLTAANNIWIVEAPWSPEYLMQILRRAWRRGQTRTCFARFLAIAGSIDERVASSSARKARDIARVMQDPNHRG